MTRLQSELNRLYVPPSRPPGRGDETLQAQPATETSDAVRSMVMELAGPPSWDLLAKVWRGAQAELGLPAPGIAVSGSDGLQLWFSLEAAVAAPRANAFLLGLRARFLADVEPGRIRLEPTAEAPPGPGARDPSHHAPPRLVRPGQWSAFVARDLAPVFADTPWLDIPPNEDGQAELLRGLEPMKPAAFEAACKQLRPGATPPAAAAAAPAPIDGAPGLSRAATADRTAGAEAQRFLLRVMNDEDAALALRVEAAKTLLSHCNGNRAAAPPVSVRGA